MQTMIRAYLKDNHQKWDEHLANFECAINTAVHEVTKYTPFAINFDWERVGAVNQCSTYRVDNNVVPDVDSRDVPEGFGQLYKEIRN